MKSANKLYTYPINIPHEMRDELLIAARLESDVENLSFNQCVQRALRQYIKKHLPKNTKPRKQTAQEPALFAHVKI